MIWETPIFSWWEWPQVMNDEPPSHIGKGLGELKQTTSGRKQLGGLGLLSGESKTDSALEGAVQLEKLV